MDLANTLQGMRSLNAQFKQQQSSGPIQAGTSCSCNSNNNSRKKVNKGDLNANGQDKTKDHNDEKCRSRIMLIKKNKGLMLQEQETMIP